MDNKPSVPDPLNIFSTSIGFNSSRGNVKGGSEDRLGNEDEGCKNYNVACNDSDSISLTSQEKKFYDDYCQGPPGAFEDLPPSWKKACAVDKLLRSVEDADSTYSKFEDITTCFLVGFALKTGGQSSSFPKGHLCDLINSLPKEERCYEGDRWDAGDARAFSFCRNVAKHFPLSPGQLNDYCKEINTQQGTKYGDIGCTCLQKWDFVFDAEKGKKHTQSKGKTITQDYSKWSWSFEYGVGCYKGGNCSNEEEICELEISKEGGTRSGVPIITKTHLRWKDCIDVGNCEHMKYL